jgi:hypothetical protein
VDTLDYRTPKRSYLPTAADRRWFHRRLLYYAGHVLLFAAIIYRAGPNMFLFHRPWSPKAADYTAMTRDYVAMIAAIKAYQRDTQSMPFDTLELPKGYQPSNYRGEIGRIYGTPRVTFAIGHNVLVYDFSSATEGWYVYAPRYHGPIAAPRVPPAPPPVTRPTTTRNADAV